MSKKQHQSISDSIQSIASGVRRLGLLYVEKARLQATEKVTILLSTIAFTATMLALALILMVFITIGVGHLLATTVAPHLAYLIVAAFYLLVIIILIAMRRRIFIDPIARFMSRLLVQAPESDDPADAPLAPRSRNDDNEAENDDDTESAVPDLDIDLDKIDDSSEAADDYDEIARRIAKIIKRRGKKDAIIDGDPDAIIIEEIEPLRTDDAEGENPRKGYENDTKGGNES